MAENNMPKVEPLLSIDEWLEKTENPPPSYIDQLLPAEPGEYMLVAGRTGIGKSILVIHLALCLVNGIPFFGFNCRKIKVGCLVMEGGVNNVRDRLRKIIPQYPSKENLRFEMRPPLLLEKHTDEFMQLFKGCQVVILDNLRQVAPGRYLEPTAAATFLKIYQACLGKIGAVGIITCHIKKPNPNSLIGDIYEIKGATEYVDACSTALLLERKRQPRSEDGSQFGKVDYSRVMLHFSKARIATKDLTPLELLRNYEEAGFDLIKKKSYDVEFTRPRN